MRESIGGAWLLGIVLAFIALFSGYLAFSVNYSKAFRIKDGIIDIIEKHNGPNKEAIKEINDLMNQVSYNSKGSCSTFFEEESSSLNFIGVLRDQAEKGNTASKTAYNYCVQEVQTLGSNGQLTASYYKVYVFFSISLPFVNSSLFQVNGESQALYYPDRSCMGGC